MTRLPRCFIAFVLYAGLAAAEPRPGGTGLPVPAAPAEAVAEPAKPLSLPAPPGTRGRMLYENHCLGCHESVLHVREKRTLRSLDELRAAVARWAREAKAPWGQEEDEEVVRHLNRTFYGFPPP